MESSGTSTAMRSSGGTTVRSSLEPRRVLVCVACPFLSLALSGTLSEVQDGRTRESERERG